MLVLQPDVCLQNFSVSFVGWIIEILAHTDFLFVRERFSLGDGAGDWKKLDVLI